jgi:hypothetical protein
MNELDPLSSKKLAQRCLSRRHLLCGAAGTVAGASFLLPQSAFPDHDDDRAETGGCALAAPIPGGVVPFKPFGVPVHHNPLNPANPLADISDPSQITDFDGFVGLTHIRGGGTGTTDAGTMTLAYQADMGFSKGKFIGVDGRRHEGTFAFV